MGTKFAAHVISAFLFKKSDLLQSVPSLHASVGPSVVCKVNSFIF